jgi:hypothetical protein
MNTRTVTDIESWDRRPADDDLGTLAEQRFSGAVRAGESYLFVVVGRPVGAFDFDEDTTGDLSTTPTDLSSFEGSIESFATPDDALPLLYAMQASDSELKGRYYSNNTSIREVDRTLQEGGFTGYLELSENVLSGDYYLVYHGGTRRTVAFVGQSERLKTDEEAFDLAIDEVGIYNIKQVSLPDLSFPERTTEPSTGTSDATASGETTDHDMSDTANGESQPSGEATDSLSDLPSGYGEVSTPADEDGSTTDTVSAGNGDPGATKTHTSGESSASDIDIDLTPTGIDGGPSQEANGSDDQAGSGENITGVNSAEQTDTDTEVSTQVVEPTSSKTKEIIPAIIPLSEERTQKIDTKQKAPSQAEPPETILSEQSSSAEDTQSQVGSTAPVGNGTSTTEPGPTSEEGVGPVSVADDHVIPSVDPGRTAHASAVENENGTSDTAETVTGEEADTDTSSVDDKIVEQELSRLRAVVNDRQEALSARTSDLEQVRGDLAEREAVIESLRERLAESTSRVEAMSTRIAELENQVGATEETVNPDLRSLSPAEGLAGTSLFIRYRSKREPTLDDVSDGVESGGVTDNLRLEHHTQFDASKVSIDGNSFEAFISSIQPYKFVQWLIRVLPYEIRDTGNAKSLKALYSAIPTLDRVEFATGVEVEDETVTFDLVCRDRMGRPLLVANLSDVRDPTNAEQLGSLVEDATVVSRRHESLVAAFAVTSAYFEPAALETANDATSESLFSRSKHKSFLRVSRNQGFHVGLVEDREESFYLSVPEL